MDTDNFEFDDDDYQWEDGPFPGDENNPPDVIKQIRSGEILAEPNFTDEDSEHEASLALDAFLELLQNRENTVASEFLFYFASRNFAFCKKVATLLEDRVKPKGGSRISEEELLETQRRFDDPAIAHLSAVRRREIAGAPNNITPEAVQKRLRRAEGLVKLHKVKDAAAQAELDIYLSPPEPDPNQPPLMANFRNVGKPPESG